MAHTICHIVYGVPWTWKLEELAESVTEGDALKDWLSPEGRFEGFKTLKSGKMPYPPGYFGVELTQIDEFDNANLLSRLGGSLEPSVETQKEVQTMFETLPETIREACEPLSLYLVWSGG